MLNGVACLLVVDETVADVSTIEFAFSAISKKSGSNGCGFIFAVFLTAVFPVVLSV